MKRVILILAGILLGSSCWAKQIRNDRMAVIVEGNVVSIECLFNEAMSVPDLGLSGPIISCEKSRVQSRKWGRGQRLTVLHANRRTTLTLFDHDPFVQVTTTFVNETDADVSFYSLDIATPQLVLGDDFSRLNTLGSGGLKPISKAQGSYTYSVLTDPESYNSIVVGWLTQYQGTGVMIPRTGEDSYRVTLQLQFGNFRVEGNGERLTDTFVIGFFDDGRDGLELFGDNLAKEYDVQLMSKPEVYCTWYHRSLSGSGSSTQAALTSNAEFAQTALKPFGLGVMQIDDHWQNALVEGYDYKTRRDARGKLYGPGPVKCFSAANSHFPDGMQSTAKMLNDNGFVAGIWFIPFSGDALNPRFDHKIFTRNPDGEPFVITKWSGTPIDATSPYGAEFLRERFKHIYDWGYRYFKVDGLHSGAPSENTYIDRQYKGNKIYADATLYDSSKTFMQGFRMGLDILNESAPDAFLLGCSATQNMHSLAAAFGKVDAMRVGPDNDAAMRGNWDVVTRGADYAGNLYFLHNRVWYNDPDPFYVRESNPLECVKWMASWQAVSGAMNTTSMQYDQLSQERLDILKRTLPTHNLNARAVDILESEHPRIWTVGNDRMTVVGLFNWSDTVSEAIECDLDDLGLDDTRSYDVYDYWADEYLGPLTDELKMTLEPRGCKVLSLKPTCTHPSVVSTSRHITQGLMDVVDEKWNSAARSIEGVSRVVAGDTYQLRIVVPEGYRLDEATFDQAAYDDATLDDATLDGAEPMQTEHGRTEKMLSEQSGRLLRVWFVPTSSGQCSWRLSFTKD